jgi:hypothetical protein
MLKGLELKDVSEARRNWQVIRERELTASAK